jgi:hypothetical protein
MKRAGVLLFGCVFTTFLNAQVTSINVVGYYNLPIYPGNNLIANQLIPTNSTLDYILNYSAVGSTFTKWDSSLNQFLPLSVFNGTNWSVNYSLTLGEGGLLNAPSGWTNTFVGDVGPYIPLTGTNIWQPNYANGLHLISDPIPRSTNVSLMFSNVVGRAPQEGEWVQILDSQSQTYLTTTFHVGTGWDNGDPIMKVGQSAWFNLGPVQVPEPGAVALLGLGVGILCWRRRNS